MKNEHVPQRPPELTPAQAAGLMVKRAYFEKHDAPGTCGRCRFFDVDEMRPQEGECRRFPPVPVALPVVVPGQAPRFTAISCTPSVSRIEHCGEFKKRMVS